MLRPSKFKSETLQRLFRQLLNELLIPNSLKTAKFPAPAVTPLQTEGPLLIKHTGSAAVKITCNTIVLSVTKQPMIVTIKELLTLVGHLVMDLMMPPLLSSTPRSRNFCQHARSSVLVNT